MTALQLRTRLTIWFAASILLILAPFLAWVLTLQWRSMREALDHHLQEDLEVVLEMLVPRDGAIVWRTLADQDLGYDAGTRRWVEVYARDGAVRYLRGLPERPAVCVRLRPTREMCGDSDSDAMAYLIRLEQVTSPETD